ncbi:carbohydrate ABC transporter permease [Aquamicrobium sp. LC103]|uniref:carbohydrate ABC transporter permease n=1 Tax=Aquamicrobium sp. LC103 TaxID=1120658 RepID=UPI00063E7DC6|nr:carbohydrate ABC transporter permease [Aquamicrobium sp. LC103]TKT76274.1 carbohydrate ABC transporter permease [Aquamicrobium sp. LC103]
MKKKARKLTPGIVVRRIILWGFAVWCLFPIYWLVNMSLKEAVDAASRPPTFVFVPTLVNYAEVIQDPRVAGFLTNSLIIALAATFFGLLIGAPAAYVLARHRFRGDGKIAFWILATRFTPPIAMLIPFFVIFYNLGLLGTHTGLVIAHVGINLAMIVWILRGFFQDLPRDLEEAAFIDGAGRFESFRKVILPLALPGIAAVGILTFLSSWNEFLFSMVLGGNNVMTVPVGIYAYIGFEQIEWGKLSAAATLMLAPVLVFIILFQRQLVRGLTLGAVK